MLTLKDRAVFYGTLSVLTIVIQLVLGWAMEREMAITLRYMGGMLIGIWTIFFCVDCVFLSWKEEE